MFVGLSPSQLPRNGFWSFTVAFSDYCTELPVFLWDGANMCQHLRSRLNDSPTQFVKPQNRSRQVSEKTAERGQAATISHGNQPQATSWRCSIQHKPKPPPSKGSHLHLQPATCRGSKQLEVQETGLKESRSSKPQGLELFSGPLFMRGHKACSVCLLAMLPGADPFSVSGLGAFSVWEASGNCALVWIELMV